MVRTSPTHAFLQGFAGAMPARGSLLTFLQLWSINSDLGTRTEEAGLQSPLSTPNHV